ncbi:zinc finger protein [Grosmannia clavigera kw1407]|uniref:Zinc finger protein n=1 Tax=Grosmannia clavigera (strain kw1407 / UAMH 11150) TaxID=655863 RepID=F0XK72_GROCL|nr:zinc finger protein [Grosmannia clavigera kw1407]EFX01886.1 zinc finger protein [Grosmannia clavigera kw1407]
MACPFLEATAKAWNGRGYECFLCNREFRSLQSLNQHLGSGAHQRALYHCPHTSCRQDFKTLAAFINHLESEACGFMRFSNVQSSIKGLISGDRLLGY